MIAPPHVHEQGLGAQHALLPDHPNRVQVIVHSEVARAIAQHEAFVTEVCRLAHGRRHAARGGDAAEYECRDALLAQQHIEVRGHKLALATAVDHILALCRLQLRDDVPAGLTSHEGARETRRTRTHGAELAALHLRAPQLEFGAVAERGAVALSGVENCEVAPSQLREHDLQRLDGLPRVGDGQADPSQVRVFGRTTEVALHVDDNEGRRGGIDLPHR